MTTELNLQSKNPNLYLPEPARIIMVDNFTEKDKFFRLELLSGKSLRHVPGQFVQVSVLGIGEAPISISSPPSEDNKFELCLRAVGNVTNKLHALKVGDVVHIRGPFGQGYDATRMQKLQNKHLLIIAGGIGYAPLRSLVNKVLLEKENYHKISILIGCKAPSERLYTEELAKIAKIGGNVELLETVDVGDKNWHECIGVITALIPKVELDPINTIVSMCGPPIMFKFVLMALQERKIPKENIYLSLERRMKCGVGKCGHCQMEGVYVCQEGPVFNYADIEHNEELF
jgi:sulfhydrogenase subunit gamma (sulfur reductase)